jgi:hypothetical protein
MNKEELELVLQAIKELGEAGQAAFIWWCILNFLSGLSTPIGFCTAIYMIAKTISATVIRVETKADEAIAAAMNYTTPLSPKEINTIITKLKS